VIRAIDEDNAADREYAIAAKSWGMVGSLRLLWEARAAGLWASQGLALRTIESGVRGDGNVWGHDSSPNGGTSDLGGEPVTEADYRAYLRRRGNRGQGGMQGVGPLQLTWWGFQDEADKIGGCWVANWSGDLQRWTVPPELRLRRQVRCRERPLARPPHLGRRHIVGRPRGAVDGAERDERFAGVGDRLEDLAGRDAERTARMMKQEGLTVVDAMSKVCPQGA
jgi:hypothetical protein